MAATLVSVAKRVGVDVDRAGRFVLFGLIGAAGVGVDVAIVYLALAVDLQVLAANALGWGVAVTANFVGNYRYTYGRPDGSRVLMYARYVVARGGTFVIRAILVLLLVDHVGAGGFEASLAGIAVAALAGFALAETVVFGGVSDE